MIGLTAATFGVRAAWLLQSPEPGGWDGYYYVAQAQHLARDGHFHVSDPSWGLYLLSLPHLLGAPAVPSIKLVAAVLAALCVPAAFALGRKIDARAAWWLALWAAASPALTHLAGDFPKNLGAAAPLLLGLAFIERPAVALALAGLAGWAHRLGAALALLAVPGATRRWWTFPALAAGAAVVAVLNADRIAGALGAAWPPTPWAYFALRPTSWPEAIELSLAWPALIAGAVALKRRPERRALIAALGLPLLACALPVWKIDALDLGYRLALMAPVFAVPLLLASLPLPRPHVLVAPLALACAVTGFDPHATPDYARYRQIIARIPRPLPQLLIAHQGINFLYDVETGAEAMAWAPEAALDRTAVWRLAWGIRDGEWLAFAPDGPAVRLDPDYVLVREDVWERFLTRAREEGDDELRERLADHRNPTKVRPWK